MDLIGVGRQAKVYKDGGEAVKHYIGSSMEAVMVEAQRQTFANNAGLPVPEVYGVEKVKDGVLLRMRCVEGEPIMRADMTQGEVEEALRILVALQLTMHALGAEGMPDLTERLRSRIDDPLIIRRLEALGGGERRLCHGDFHPLNILFDGEKHWIIDWVDASAGPPLADVCRTYLLLKSHLSALADAYLKIYTARTKVQPADVLAWLPVVAAARLKEGMEGEERDFLLALIEQSL